MILHFTCPGSRRTSPPEQSVELVRVDRREVLLGPQAGHVDGVLAVGEDLLVLARFGLALAPRVRRTLREPRGAALVVLALVALGRRERRDELLVPVWKSTSASGAPDNSSLSHFLAMTRPTWLGRAARCGPISSSVGIGTTVTWSVANRTLPLPSRSKPRGCDWRRDDSRGSITDWPRAESSKPKSVRV